MKRAVLVLVLALMAPGPVWSQAGWPVGSPADEGLNTRALSSLVAQIHAGDFGYINRLVVVKGGQLVVNETFDQDYREISAGRASPIGCGYGCADPDWDHQFNYFHPDWHPYYQGTRVHSLQSVTKSIAATLVGAAIHRGDIDGVGVGLLDHLKAYDLSGVPDGLHGATLEDLLTMRTGIEWHETDRPMNLTNTTIALELSDDWVRFTLAQPMDAEPGQKWVYNSGGSHLMSAIVKDATGQTMAEFAEQHLFGPLGIADYHWKHTNAGLPDALGGLYLEALDLARIGQLYLSNGVWEDERLLPEGWVEAATTRHVDRPGYGYQWWRPDTDGHEVWAGQGFGGQYLLVLPAFDTVIVVNSWNLFGGRNGNIRDAAIRAVTTAPSR